MKRKIDINNKKQTAEILTNINDKDDKNQDNIYLKEN